MQKPNYYYCLYSVLPEKLWLEQQLRGNLGVDPIAVSGNLGVRET